MGCTSLENFLLNWTDASIALLSRRRGVFASISGRWILGVAGAVLSGTDDPDALGQLLLHPLNHN